MAAVEAPQASRTSDSSELAGFGYKQELDRSLGSFSAFAAGFSYISILTGVTALFATGYLNAGPGVWWTWPVVVFGQILLPQITTKLQFFGSAADAGATFTKGGAQNALLLGTILIVVTTAINMLGVKLMSRINNFGVICELI